MSILTGFRKFIKSVKSSKERRKGSKTSGSEKSGGTVSQQSHKTNEPSSNSTEFPGLERFQVKEKLGDGAYSKVYKAYSFDLQEDVAVKVIRKYEMNSKQKSGVHKEVNIMRRIHHKNIVSLLDFIEVKDFFYLILELAEGGEIFHKIVHFTYFSEELARHVIIQIAEAIQHLHDVCGIVHRDIKPENVLFKPTNYHPSENYQAPPLDPNKRDEGAFIPRVGGGGIGKIMIGDFGFSKVVWNTKTSTPCGTVGYAAPEIVNDELYSKNVDMWALGCVLHTMLCGFPPFFDDNVRVLASKVVRGEFEFLSPWWDNISESAKDLVAHLLTVDPRERYDIHQFFQHPWIRGEPKMLSVPSHKPKFYTRSIDSTSSSPGRMTSDLKERPRRTMISRLSSASMHKSPSITTLSDAMMVAYDVRRSNFPMSHAHKKSKPSRANSVAELIVEEDSGDEQAGNSFPFSDISNSDDRDSFQLDLAQSSLISRRSARRRPM
ncbi:CAMK/CAMK1 protein kinase Cmk2 [Schizosaccharomyces cryophilus OY26]|uniref:CAMK/CAMK1 protein kinase Cmk2 n=1 Tax=Schizosaccharomyces cryophilus (strain OY26 / ATCC MYA-4695 / CBS 11777 / NBRC 106824 / NRRL Y48691) TaxID=653667 RepID=S9W076_SCHCR|nr:CAMK/CAMK1 protein kinase Cmk2 [Schizosaccharomyces cryophilus OY26]EPY51450.1 CAMK/CAMK1 protein kinase Cmk2 [Schizosaccharomyces cryophilus OY26]